MAAYLPAEIGVMTLGGVLVKDITLVASRLFPRFGLVPELVP
jgi:hypothetical protein